MLQNNELILSGGTIIDPLNRRMFQSDIYIEDGVIKKIAKNLAVKVHKTSSPAKGSKPESNIKEFDIKGKYVAPGFVDLHAHLREPGREDEETIETGSYAALSGGFTKVCCMPNTEPPIDNEGVVRFILQESARVNFASVLTVGAATKGRKGEEISEIGSLVKAGVVAVSDDGEPISNPFVMRRVLEYTKAFDLPVMSHCEVKALSEDGVMNEGIVSTRLGLRGIPDVSEAAMVYQHILLADYTKSRLHLAHISSKKSVEIIRWAKEKGIDITCETCPHYFSLTDAFCSTFDTNYKVNPPLQTQADVEAIRQGLSEGLIDAIATDHAPHLASEKEVEFDLAPFGMIGFQTAFALGYEELVVKKYLNMVDYIAKLTVEPAKILKLEPPTIEIDKKANLVIFDTKIKWTFKRESIHSKSQNSPFIGKELIGKVMLVITGGRGFDFSKD
ncbi:MAG: dihydroorotase [candidate division WOR-3 bacterium]|nr:dihydroorotase [candidate division WOR-3 bacterium]